MVLEVDLFAGLSYSRFCGPELVQLKDKLIPTTRFWGFPFSIKAIARDFIVM